MRCSFGGISHRIGRASPSTGGMNQQHSICRALAERPGCRVGSTPRQGRLSPLPDRQDGGVQSQPHTDIGLLRSALTAVRRKSSTTAPPGPRLPLRIPSADTSAGAHVVPSPTRDMGERGVAKRNPPSPGESPSSPAWLWDNCMNLQASPSKHTEAEHRAGED